MARTGSKARCRLLRVDRRASATYTASMAATEERVRFCGHCNAVVSWYATYCAECGLSLTAEHARKGPPATVEGRVREYFRGQMRLLHRAREETMRLVEHIQQQAGRVAALEGRKSSEETRRELLLCGERIMDLEQEWDEIQRRFNGATEALEEGFSTEVAEVDGTMDLPLENIEALQAEGASLDQDLSNAEERICVVRRQRDVVHARHKNAWAGLATGARGTVILASAVFVAAACGAVYGIGFAALEPQALVLSLLPAWLGMMLLFLNARAKSL